jgi:hypothetical protein
MHKGRGEREPEMIETEWDMDAEMDSLPYEKITCPDCLGYTCQYCECEKPECDTCDNTGKIDNPDSPMNWASDDPRWND